ncbi:FadR/GntR family transcriptional regulator [soil metagenome]
MVASLGSRITTGKLEPGSMIDSDAVASEANASRTVVREAFRVLAAKGLITSRPHVGTTVRPRSDWRVTDPEVMTWRTAAGVDARLVREVDEVRSAIEPLGARLAAQRADDRAIARIREAMAGLRDASDDPGSEVWVDADVRLHRAILQAAGNELLASLEVLLEPALQARDRVVGAGGDPHQAIALHESVVVAIEHRRTDAAERAMRRLIARSAAEAHAAVNPGDRADGTA